MKRILTAALATAMLLFAGCSESGSAHTSALRELQQQNAALQHNLSSAGTISSTLGVVVVIIGCALAVSLYANMRDANRKDQK